MTDEEIYKLWFSKTDDLRYLRPERWEELKRVILDQKVKSVLEFGSGVSTLLFNNLGLKVLSIETDVKYIKFVSSICPTGPVFRRWNNKSMPIKGFYDLALVDGNLPRGDQLRLALEHAGIVAIDDFEKDIRGRLIPKLTNYERIDRRNTTLAIFKEKN